VPREWALCSLVRQIRCAWARYCGGTHNGAESAQPLITALNLRNYMNKPQIRGHGGAAAETLCGSGGKAALRLRSRHGDSASASMDSFWGDLCGQKIDKSTDLARQMVATRVRDVDRLAAVVAPFGEDVDEPAAV
jgi:hypothetical protein